MNSSTPSILFAGILAFALGTASGQFRTEKQASTILRANQIELVDEGGRPRFSMRVETNGEAVFRMTDQAGTIRVKIGAGKGGAAMVLLNENTETGIHTVARDGKAFVHVVNTNGQRKALEP